jgi:nucleotide-binding universal stress UspA family protein
MTYATVMVSLAIDQPNDARLAVACQIAERFQAGLVGIVAAVFSPPPYFTIGEEAQKLVDQGQASIRRRISELENQFREVTKNRAKHVEWRCAVDFPARYVLKEARCADLIVSGGRSDAFSDPFGSLTPRDMVMEAGRPLLVVPDSVDWLDSRSMLVAWKDTPEARRAIVAALPMLRKARDVAVAEIVEQEGGQTAAPVERVRDVARWLLRHGVSASELVALQDQDQNAGDQLDGLAANVGAGTIVAGAYGHSRFRELILGGVTQHLITQSARCALLAH